MSDFDIVVIGGGGHAKVIIGTLRTAGARILGFTELDAARRDRTILGVGCLGGDEYIRGLVAGEVALALGIGDPGARERLYDEWTALGFRFPPVIHPGAQVDTSVTVEPGAQIMAGTVVQPGVRLGANCLLNTGSRVDHDSTIAPHAVIGPGAVLCGCVTIGTGAVVGPGVTIVQGRSIGARSVVGAAALVLNDIDPGKRAWGTPAKENIE